MPVDPTVWTAWLAMAGYAASVAICLSNLPSRAAESRSARWFWTVSCAMLWIHVASAFQFQHNWSHAAAYAHTARKTEELIGLSWGGGLYFNYLVLFVWTADAVWWWMGPRAYGRRPAALGAMVRGLIAFMAFNATVVFASGLLRWFAALVTGVFAVWAIRRRRAS
jgi:hypothetical protein